MKSIEYKRSLKIESNLRTSPHFFERFEVWEGQKSANLNAPAALMKSSWNREGETKSLKLAKECYGESGGDASIWHTFSEQIAIVPKFPMILLGGYFSDTPQVRSMNHSTEINHHWAVFLNNPWVVVGHANLRKPFKVANQKMVPCRYLLHFRIFISDSGSIWISNPGIWDLSCRKVTPCTICARAQHRSQVILPTKVISDIIGWLPAEAEKTSRSMAFNEKSTSIFFHTCIPAGASHFPTYVYI